MKTRLLIAVLISGMSMYAFASEKSEENERMYLIQILNQLNAVKPLIVAAAKEQPKTNRIQFHYTRYRDIDGYAHNGLIEDINEIEKGIKEKLHHIPNSPHLIKPIKGDYIEHTKSEIKTW